LETVERDYAPQGVKFYYIYKSLAHPEKDGYVQPYTLKERLMHVAEAKRTLGTKIPWLCDAMQNDLKHFFRGSPNSEFVLGPDLKIVRKRNWSDPAELREDLAELVGPVENPTKVSDLDLKTAPPPKVAPQGIVKRITLPGNMSPLIIKPQSGPNKQPFYVKLRAEAERGLLGEGKGRLYLGFHLDPLYHVHWNNLAKPLRVEIKTPNGVTVTPITLEASKPKEEADIDPREFLVDVEANATQEPIELAVYYFACNDEQGWCKPVSQTYLVYLDVDRDGGRARRGGRPGGGRFAGGRPGFGRFGGGRPGFGPPGGGRPRDGSFGQISKVDVEKRVLVLRTRGGQQREVRIAEKAQLRRNGEECQLKDLKVGDFCRFELDKSGDKGEKNEVVQRLMARDTRPDFGRRGGRNRPQ
jgi:hypothetical protein